MSNPGRISVYSQQKNALTARLYNFDIAKHQLKPDHEDWLRRNVLGFLQSGGSIWLTGLASPSDTDDFNMALSRRRVDAVIGFLRKESRASFKIAFDAAMGETMARAAGVPDGTEDENWRAVILSVWQLPDPPPPPPPPPPPRTVERRHIVRFIADIDLKDKTGDPKAAEAFSKWAMDQVLTWQSRVREDTRFRVPETHRVLTIKTFLEKSEAKVPGIAGVTIKICHVIYEWGVRKGPVVLVHGYWRDGAFTNSNPIIYNLSDAQADLWVNEPHKALEELP